MKVCLLQKSVLVICPFDNIYPPSNGGMQRCFHIIHQLSKISYLTIIIKQDKDAFLLSAKAYPSLQRVNVISIKDIKKRKDLFSLLPGKFQNSLRFRWYIRKLRYSADSNLLEYYAELKQLLKQHFDLVILETPAAYHAANVIRRWNKSIRIIYDAHNVDSNLEKGLIGNEKVNPRSLKLIEKSERLLYKSIGEIFTCSEKDKHDFVKISKGRLKIFVIPNGVVINEKLNDTAVRSDSPEYVLFCGFLGSPSNWQGILWFYRDIWPLIKKLFPHLKLLILGSGGIPSSLHNMAKDQGIVFTGKVEDVKPIYDQSMVSIVPLKSGSGTRLKILEAMSFGIPIVSTSIGAEGIDYTNQADIFIADEEKVFAEKVIYLLNSKTERLRIQQNARKLVENKYDWNIIGEKLADTIYE